MKVARWLKSRMWFCSALLFVHLSYAEAPNIVAPAVSDWVDGMSPVFTDTSVIAIPFSDEYRIEYVRTEDVRFDDLENISLVRDLSVYLTSYDNRFKPQSPLLLRATLQAYSLFSVDSNRQGYFLFDDVTKQRLREPQITFSLSYSF